MAFNPWRRLASALLWAIGGALAAGTAGAQTVTINPNTSYQTIRGFGGMNGAGWIADLTSSQIDAAFGTAAGQVGLSIMRMRIDADSSTWATQLPTAAAAKAKGVTLFATPWTPPASMKSNGSRIGGSLLAASYGDYASFLLNFASYMSSGNAALYAVSIQNEPDWLPNYDSCSWTSDQFRAFLTAQGSRFGSLKVIVTESLNASKTLGDPILNDASAAAQMDIMGGHFYGVSPSDYPLARSKGKELWMTEHYTDNTDANDWTAALPVGLELHNTMMSNYSAYVWWYIRRSYGLLTEDGLISKRGHVMSQFARFVRPGMVRIAATEKPYSDVFVSAYKDSAGKLVVVVINNGTSQRRVDLTLAAGSATSFTKTRTSSTVSSGYAGSYAVSGGVASAYVDPGSINTFVSQ